MGKTISDFEQINAKFNSQKAVNQENTSKKASVNGFWEKNGKVLKKILTILLSVGVGAINGLFGGGGGMLVVPLFTVFMGLEEKRAHSSAILAILPLSLISGIIYLIRGDFTLYSGGFVTAGVILGGILGTFVMKKLSNNVLAIVFYAVMIFVGVSSLVGALNR